MSAEVRLINPFVEYALRLVGDRVGDNQKMPTLQVGVRKNEVTLTVYTGGKDGEGRNESIPAKMVALEFGAMIAGLQTAINAEPGFREGYRCYVPRKRQPGDTGFPKLLAATVVIGKDKTGLVYISVVRKDPPHIKFVFRSTKLGEVVNATGDLLDAGTASCRYAQSWITIVTPLVTHLLATQVYDFRDDPANQNNDYNNNRNNGNNGNQQQRPAPAASNAMDSFEDDIPM